jgi:hypothetical protein
MTYGLADLEFVGHGARSLLGRLPNAKTDRWRPPHRPLHPLPGPIPTDLNDRHSRMMPPAPFFCLDARLEPHRLNVWPGDDEVVLDEAEGEGGDGPKAAQTFLRSRPCTATAQRFSAPVP